ncbi:hypothetical protein [Pedobacter sp. JY14-1]|uniref:hypothetical protein n=1 Tax=Pedobacter sp. JY14-1 TaxID=3034151 RepID=UPI0023E1D6B1|nr:hypothetical protein [Pedobacter sp. JY14-1]
MNTLFLRNQLCIPADGFNRAVIYDLTRKDYHQIPRELYQALDTNDIIDFRGLGETGETTAHIDFLLEEEIIFSIPDVQRKNHFPPLNTDFESPSHISNMVVHSNIRRNLAEFLGNINLQNLSVIADRPDDQLSQLLSQARHLEVDSIYLYIRNFDPDAYTALRELLSGDPLVFSVNFFGLQAGARTSECHDNIYYNFFDLEFGAYKLRLTHDKLVINKEHFLEALHFHTYYHGKVYIDEQGYLKNGLNCSNHFGHIAQMSGAQLSELICSEDFRKLGTIRKDDTLVCADCELRYMCVDSRVPVRGKQGWYHPDECAYNPYLSKWDDEPGYVRLSDCGVTVNEKGLTIDRERLSVVFERAWST